MGRQQQEDIVATLLPDDVLADVLRRLAPRGLAASRCVCRSWRLLIDDRRLLRADLLPRSLAGFFLNHNELRHPEFLARPGVMDSTGYVMPRGIQDHSNGLVLEDHSVLNPATGRRAHLPDPPPPLLDGEYFLDEYYLAFDPTESPHYEVFSVPMVLAYDGVAGLRTPAISRSEWPPSPFVLNVFTSRTGRWEERPLVRQGEAAGTTVGDMDCELMMHFHSACWRGALYVHRQNDFVLRISLSDDVYRVINPPKEMQELRGGFAHLGRSQKGVYFAFIDCKSCLWVWIFDDSLDKMEWVLRHRSSVCGPLPTPKSNQESYRPWILTKVNKCSTYGLLVQDESDNSEAPAEQEPAGWDSDDENILHTEKRIPEKLAGLTILGFHPYKEIVFFDESSRGSRGLAYHLKTSKLEDLGDCLYPKGYTSVAGSFSYIESAFPYTPCWMGEL